MTMLYRVDRSPLPFQIKTGTFFILPGKTPNAFYNGLCRRFNIVMIMVAKDMVYEVVCFIYRVSLKTNKVAYLEYSIHLKFR